MLRFAASSLSFLLVVAAGLLIPGTLYAYGPQGFDTVVIDAGHGGLDRGGGPGQIIPEKPYTLDTALRLQRLLRDRGFRTVMTRTEDVFVPLPQRVAIANSFSNAIFLSIHYNSAPRADAHGYETYYYHSDSFGLATRLQQAQLATLNTDDRHVRRRGFFVVRRTNIPAVLCEGGFLTNPAESRIVLSPSYRQQWAENIANALVAQRREGDPDYLGRQPVVTTERLVAASGGSRRHSRGSRGGRHHTRGTAHHGGSSHRHTASSTTHHQRRRRSNN